MLTYDHQKGQTPSTRAVGGVFYGIKDRLQTKIYILGNTRSTLV